MENIVSEGGSWKWRSDPMGAFSVRQVRVDIEAAAAGVNNISFGFRWNSWATPKANVLLWRAINGKIASKVGLIHKGVHLADSICSRCGLSDEDPEHVFVKCLWSRCIWWNVLAWVRISFPINSNNLQDLIDYLSNCPGCKIWKKTIYAIVMATVWRIWIARNKKVFDDHFIPISRTVEQIKEDVFLWLCNRSKVKMPSWDNWRDFDIQGML
ncbi:putative reverse transcriptase zinc-binding domain-containing protein [Helianthus annuus]|nr:putative reverse transcriptase zinc-binding domain-containing protein [Helianthus annuus]